VLSDFDLFEINEAACVARGKPARRGTHRLVIARQL
jgi:hypothetical protein